MIYLRFYVRLLKDLVLIVSLMLFEKDYVFFMIFVNNFFPKSFDDFVNFFDVFRMMLGSNLDVFL